MATLAQFLRVRPRRPHEPLRVTLATKTNARTLGLPYSVVRFSSGKFYNADLNAAYNIGARYYIRLLLDFLKARLSSEDFGALSAKVPRCSARSKCVLSDLIDLWRVACS